MQDVPLPDSVTARARKLGHQYELGLLTEQEVAEGFQEAIDLYLAFENHGGHTTWSDLAKRMILDLDLDLDLPPGAIAGLWQFIGRPVDSDQRTALEAAADRALLRAVSSGNSWAFENLALVAYADRAVPDPVWEAVREMAVHPHMEAFAALVEARDLGTPDNLKPADASGRDRTSTKASSDKSTGADALPGDTRAAPRS